MENARSELRTLIAKEVSAAAEAHKEQMENFRYALEVPFRRLLDRIAKIELWDAKRAFQQHLQKGSPVSALRSATTMLELTFEQTGDFWVPEALDAIAEAIDAMNGDPDRPDARLVGQVSRLLSNVPPEHRVKATAISGKLGELS